MNEISEILEKHQPALLVGNGINRYKDSGSSSWTCLLAELAKPVDIELPQAKTDEMTYTEFFDILDLARPRGDRDSLQQHVCDLMEDWKPSDHHRTIVCWAKRHGVPIITTNFDENLSRSIDARFHSGNGGKGFTHLYPWNSHFSDREIDAPRRSFAIWHAHGMMQYPKSIRLGLTHYVGSARKARALVYDGGDSLRARAKGGESRWRGQNTWLDALFFCPLMIFGFACERNENLLRWLFLERARLYNLQPKFAAKAWFLDTSSRGGPNSKHFFERLGVDYVSVADCGHIYENPAWGK